MSKNVTKPAKNIIFAILICLILVASLLFLRESSRPFFVFGHSAFVVKSDSMQPEFNVGSLVIVQKIDINDVLEGDVIAYNSDALGGQLALHRVSAVHLDGLTTKGDANPFEDGQIVNADDFVGVCVFNTGALPIFTVRGFILLVCVPLCALAATVFAAKSIKKGGVSLSRKKRNDNKTR